MTDQVVKPEVSLKRPFEGEQKEEAHPPQPIFPEDSSVTKAEKVEGNGVQAEDSSSSLAETTQKIKKEDANADMEDAPAAKRIKLSSQQNIESAKADTREKIKGIALVKPEYVATIIPIPSTLTNNIIQVPYSHL
jgi:tRNA-dihydrouridine synthase 3